MRLPGKAVSRATNLPLFRELRAGLVFWDRHVDGSRGSVPYLQATFKDDSMRSANCPQQVSDCYGKEDNEQVRRHEEQFATARRYYGKLERLIPKIDACPINKFNRTALHEPYVARDLDRIFTMGHPVGQRWRPR